MIPRRKGLILLVLIFLALIIHFYSTAELRVENGYSTHFYVYFSDILRALFGRIPFSMGDLLYGIIVFWLTWNFVKLIRQSLNKGIPKRQLIAKALYKLAFFFTHIYIIFNVFWGINYNRKGIAWQLGLKMEKYSTAELQTVTALLIEQINASKRSIVEGKIQYPANRALFQRTDAAYRKAAVKYPFLAHEHASIKSSLWGWLGNYTGFTGYYNPFTGEAQVNTTVPRFLQPFVSCHEVAHQVGYAKEMEANFVGYLAASNSADTVFRYSVYLDLFIYANRNLAYVDTAAAASFRRQLRPEVIKDLKDWAAFNRRHQSWVEPIVRWIYGKYLQGNMQPSGILSYDEVTGFLVAFYKKYGHI